MAEMRPFRDWAHLVGSNRELCSPIDYSAESWFQSTSGSGDILNRYICPWYIRLSTIMVNLVLLLKRTPNFYGVEKKFGVSNTWMLMVLKLSIVRMSWPYLPQFSIHTILHIHLVLSQLRCTDFESKSCIWTQMSHFCIPVSHPHDCSKHFTLYSLADLFNQTPSHLLCEASSHAANIVRRPHLQISTSVYTAEWTVAK